ncbi:hypothetical protein BD289DRAFT_421599 [Coniella lustricola]|uniref:Uncharacterized protein n=1 Tax=Coniella lustricola TaxID=2025994 RepID=A0A2T3ALS9_9PEZI|nr:hypothetical protein BD289DRAFT_421599 [Coniella lustricola]
MYRIKLRDEFSVLWTQLILLASRDADPEHPFPDHVTQQGLFRPSKNSTYLFAQCTVTTKERSSLSGNRKIP